MEKRPFFDAQVKHKFLAKSIPHRNIWWFLRERGKDILSASTKH